MSNPEVCPFCAIEAGRIIEAYEHTFVVLDAFPISTGHSLVVSRRHVADIFDLTVAEISEIIELIGSTRRRIDQMFHPTGYNVGVNVGHDAGQTVMHVHVHVIPRYPGDVAEPAGGVRAVIPGKRLYL